MTYILSFLFCGIVCAISQYVLEKTKWTPGHMNTLLVTGASEGYLVDGFIGLFKGVLVNASAGISYTILISFIVSLLFKVKN